MSSLSWLDAEGSASLSNTLPAPGNRFGGWTPDRNPIGPPAIGLGTGRLHRFEFRRDDIVSFTVAAIPDTQLDLLRRLVYHLLNGGLVSVTSDRLLASDFAFACLAPETVPTYDMSDNVMLEYTLSVVLKAVAEADIPATEPNYPAFVPEVNLWLYAGILSSTKEDGDFVSVWPDASGEDNDAVQATSANQMTFQTDVIDGHPVLEGSNGNGSTTGKFMATPYIMQPTVGSVFYAVMKSISTHISDTNFIGWDGVIHGHASARIEEGSSSPNVSDNTWREGGGNVNIGADPDEWSLLKLRFTSSTSAEAFQNNVAVGSAFNPHAHFDEVKRILVGGSAANAPNAQYAEILQAEAISETVQDNITAYIAAKYPSLGIV